jgi:hypothetical protein
MKKINEQEGLDINKKLQSQEIKNKEEQAEFNFKLQKRVRTFEEATGLKLVQEITT